ncbi:MAG: tetratricopeptide repeat protein [Candidatus Angelobacter sp.]
MTTLYRALFFLITVVNLAAAAQQQGKSDVCPREAKEFTAVQRRAEANDAVAQMALASCYDLGMHVQPDGKESIRWLTQAANQDYVPAEYELARIYLYGRGIPIDYEKALLWERKAAEQGDPRAQRDLAFMYERGLGVEHDAARVAALNRKAAEKGDAKAQLRLAQALESGDGVTKDENEAELWYIKAGMQKVPEAQFSLAQIYARKIPLQCKKTVEWYGRAADSGDAQAMYELGKLYQEKKCAADGPSTDSAAYTWFSLGGRFGSSPSRLAAEVVSATLKPVQKRNADLAIERWMKKYNADQKKEGEEEEEER